MAQQSPNPPEASKEAAATYARWAVISALLMIAGMAAWIFLHTIWPLGLAIGAAVALQFLMFRKFRRPPGE